MLQWIHRIREVSPFRTTVRRIVLPTVVFVFLFALLVPVLGVHAQSAQQGSVGNDIIASNNAIAPVIGLPTTDIRVIVARIIRVALGLLGVGFVCLILYGGFIWMTAGGSEEKVSTAKRIITNGVIGLVIILSSYAITLFIFKMLGFGGTGEGGDGGGGNIAFVDQNFFGSGALGSVVRDHYPGRDQRDVPRNAKIIITFRRAVNPSSFIVDSNNGAPNGTFGDCINMGSSMDWRRDCDTLNMGDNFITIRRADTNAPISGANVLASYESGGVFTVVIRPFDYLGSDLDKVGYIVRVGNGITWNDPTNNNPSIFAGRSSGRDFYQWNFITDTILDRTPPHVANVFPRNGVTEARNSIIQVNFDKPMDPSTIQGPLVWSPDGFFMLSSASIILKTGSSTLPAGSFRIVNNYQTLEFTPGTACGQNACGGTVYCMPVCDAPGASCSTDSFTVLLRAARTFAGTSFEAIPFTGITDVSGNALDGNSNNAVDPVTTTPPVFPNQLTGDNYYWRYNLSSALDITAPTLTQTTPGPNASFVAPTAELSMTFDKRLRADSLYNILLSESPASDEPLCFVPRALFNTIDSSTNVRLEHCPFLSAARHYYYPAIDSRIEDVHFNCYYPGQGPNGLSASSTSSNICDAAHPQNCCSVVDAPTSSAFCCNGAIGFPDRQSCLNHLNLTP